MFFRWTAAVAVSIPDGRTGNSRLVILLLVSCRGLTLLRMGRALWHLFRKRPDRQPWITNYFKYMARTPPFLILLKKYVLPRRRHTPLAHRLFLGHLAGRSPPAWHGSVTQPYRAVRELPYEYIRWRWCRANASPVPSRFGSLSRHGFGFYLQCFLRYDVDGVDG
jgi:hypothetical protein